MLFPHWGMGAGFQDLNISNMCIENVKAHIVSTFWVLLDSYANSFYKSNDFCC